jgi:hypothetical protein
MDFGIEIDGGPFWRLAHGVTIALERYNVKLSYLSRTAIANSRWVAWLQWSLQTYRGWHRGHQ